MASSREARSLRHGKELTMGKFDGILLASDIDGTIAIGSDISKENRRAVEYFIDNGGLFTLATGRAPEYIDKLNIPTNAPMIVINGTVVYDKTTDKVLVSYTFPKENISVAKRVLGHKNLKRISIFSFEEYYYENPDLRDFDKFDKPINKIVFAFDDEQATLDIKKTLESKYSPQFVFERSWNTGLEMRCCQSGKGVCLDFIKKLTGAKTCIAVGDYENDRSLLLAADISYCPEGSHPEIMAIAQRKTVPCHEHSVAHIIYELDEKISKGLDI